MWKRFGPGAVGLAVAGGAAIVVLVLYGADRVSGLRGRTPDEPTSPPPAKTTAPPREDPASSRRKKTPPAPARKKKVLTSHLAGAWYPADREKLAAQLERYLDNVKGEPLDRVHALILPHAGYRYSGQTAAYGVKQIARKRYSRVIVMGPSHRVRMENMASVPDVTHYATPLGEIPLDLEFMESLKEHTLFQTQPNAHQKEHSVQIELPLLQAALGTFSLVPIVVGRLDRAASGKMAEILRGLIDKRTLVVASSDFTHYGRNFRYIPFVKDVPENLKELDMAAFKKIEAKDADGFLDYINETGATICGRFPISVLLKMLPPDSETHLLKYDTSGNLTGNFSSSVSYLSAAVKGAWPEGKAVEPRRDDESVTKEEQASLLRLARLTIAHVLKNRRMPEPAELDVKITPAMNAVRATFVTLKKDGRLRGCIGEIFPQRPLHRSVMLNAARAAFEDHRFPPVTGSEIPVLRVKISVLTPPKAIDSYEQIVIGRDGVVLQKDDRQAVFLPQVAPEQGWNVEEMLSHLARKAGLPTDGWKRGASFTVFEAHVFGEEEG